MNNIVLASMSIGRKKLFQENFRSFITSPSNIDETKIKIDNSYELTKKLAYLKALEISKFYCDDYVIGFDTIVLCDGKVLGKPSDIRQASEYLSFLRGKKQSVVTGYCIINKNKNILINDFSETFLYFKEFSEEFIDHYVHNNPVTNFAGGYGIQDNDHLIDIMEGDRDNIIGAPMQIITGILTGFGLNGQIIKTVPGVKAEYDK